MDQAAILTDYKELRRKGIPLTTRLVKMLNPQDLDIAASALGVLRGKRTIELETEDEIAVVMDYAIHNIYRDGRNAVDRLLEQNEFPEGSTELRLLRAHQDAHFTILEVTTPIRGFGVRALDGPQKEPVMIVD